MESPRKPQKPTCVCVCVFLHTHFRLLFHISEWFSLCGLDDPLTVSLSYQNVCIIFVETDTFYFSGHFDE